MRRRMTAAVCRLLRPLNSSFFMVAHLVSRELAPSDGLGDSELLLAVLHGMHDFEQHIIL